MLELVAVLPFRVAGADASLGYLREGMVDLLAAKLTGTGGLRAAEPRTVLSAWRHAGGAVRSRARRSRRRWACREASAPAGSSRGASWGRKDRITLSAALLDVAQGASVAHANVDGPEDSLPSLLDRLSAQLLTAVAGGTGFTTASLSASLPALQAYLDGVGAYRRGHYAEAGEALNRALDADSSFAAAAFMLTEAGGWEDVAGVERANRVLVRLQDRLTPRDRSLFLASNGARFPRPASGAELIAEAERAVAAYPDQPDAWYHLGDWYFHFGDLVGVPNASGRALAAFERAMVLDPDFSGPREHIIDIHAMRRDTAVLRQLERQVERDSSEGRQRYWLWRIAAAVGDSASRARRRASLDSLPLRELLIVVSNGGNLPDADTALAAMDRVATAAWPRQLAAYARGIVALQRGRPTTGVKAHAQAMTNGADQRFIDILAIHAALYADADTANAGRAVVRLAPIADAGVALKTEEWTRRPAECWVEQWRLAHGDTRSAARVISRLRAAAQPADSFMTVGEAYLCAAMLDAWLAGLTGRADAAETRLALDSIMRTGPAFWVPYQGATPANQLLARLFAAAGDTARALAAIRRHHQDWGFDEAKVTRLRAEGRLATAVGDTAGAIDAYDRYLGFRVRPEPVLIPQRDSVRSELEVLRHGQVPREAQGSQ